MNKVAKKQNIYAILAEKASESTDLRLLIKNIISETLDYMEAASGSIMVYEKKKTVLSSMLPLHTLYLLKMLQRIQKLRL